MVRLVLIIATLAAGLVALVVLGLVIGAGLDPAGSLWGVAGAMVWAPFGPFLLLAVLPAVAAGILARRAGLRRLGGAVLALAVPALVGALFILARIGVAAVAAGAAIDLPQTLHLQRMDDPPPDVVETVRRVGGTDLRAAVYLPPPSRAPVPVITYIHGGGFMTGTATETAADLRWFADRGWLVVSVDYRLFTPGRPTWDRAPEDVACALAWVSRNASRFGGDATRIALMGDSAGGNLAINLGFAAAAGRPPGPCGAEVPTPKAIAVLYPALDPLSIYEQGFPIPGFEPRMLIEGYIGGPPDRYPDRIAAVTSTGFLTAAASPTLIVLPERDSLVVPQGTRRFVDAARGAGVRVELVVLPFANHVFNQVAAGSLGNQIGRSLRLRFLERQLR